MSQPTWEDTWLWEALQRTRPEGDPLRVLVSTQVSVAEKVLQAGGTSPTDFTLHDPRHSFRVAQKMREVIPQDVAEALSGYELALLLLSAYAHDIGMTPAQRLVTGVFERIYAGQSSLDLPDEWERLQLWLDATVPDAPMPLNSRGGTLEDLRLAQSLTSQYARLRHNDWSAAWMGEHWADGRLDAYADFLDDLIDLCRSHHEGYEALASARFDPRLVGSEDVVHLRYLAAVLRIADILDVDPERTPSVIFRHRDISPGSVIYWHKDHDVSLRVRDQRVVVYARPKQAIVHRAIEDTAHGIDAELTLCRRLDEQTHFDRSSWGEPLPHRWGLASVATRDIAERPGTYTYINGAFRVDTHRILALLGGTALYGSPLAAIREMVQNAMDAVREQMAWQRLASGNPGDEAYAESLRNLHSIDISVEFGEDGARIVCSDTGTGMSREIIEDSLLVSGSGRRRDVLELERRCAEAGIRLERTGRFGIGVLSYFMLARRVTVTTRRSAEAGGREASGWRYEVESLDGFGELRADTTRPRGSEVRLDLRPDVLLHSAAAFYDRIREYLVRLLRYVPCRVRLATTAADRERLDLQPGWTMTQDAVVAMMTEQMSESAIRSSSSYVDLSLLDTETRLMWAERDANRQAELRMAVDSLKVEVLEGEFERGIGRYRAHVPWFDQGRLALAYVPVASDDPSVRPIPVSTHLLRPSGGWVMSLHGVRLEEADERHPGGAFVEVDWTSDEAGQVRADRLVLDEARLAGKLVTRVRSEVSDALEALATRDGESPFLTLNLAIAGAPWHGSSALHWLLPADGRPTAGTWGAVLPPFANRADVEPYSGRPLTLGGNRVTLLDSLWTADGETIDWQPPGLSADRIAVARFDQLTLVPVWLRHPVSEEAQPVPLARFPPGWDAIVGARVGHYDSSWYWNPAHPVIKGLDAAGQDWLTRCFPSFTNFDAGRLFRDLGPVRTDLLSDRSKAAAWLVELFRTGGGPLFRGLHERDPKFADRLLALVLGGDTVEIGVFKNRTQEIEWIGSSGWRITPAGAEHPALPVPDDLEWRLMPVGAET